MTIDETIKHSEEVAERYEKMEDSHDEKLKEECLQCAADHRQLAKWLVELKEHREADVQNEVLNYLFNKEREAESMPYSDVRQERIATLREVIRYVEGIGDTNG